MLEIEVSISDITPHVDNDKSLMNAVIKQLQEAISSNFKTLPRIYLTVGTEEKDYYLPLKGLKDSSVNVECDRISVRFAFYGDG